MNLTISQLDLLLVCVVALTAYVLFGFNVRETFQRMNYIQLHNYLDRLYRAPYWSRFTGDSPSRSYIPSTYERPTVGLTGTRGYQDDPRRVQTQYTQPDNPDRLVGYLYS